MWIGRIQKWQWNFHVPPEPHWEMPFFRAERSPPLDVVGAIGGRRIRDRPRHLAVRCVMKQFLLAGIGVLALAAGMSSASAADIQRRAVMPAKAPAYITP